MIRDANEFLEMVDEEIKKHPEAETITVDSYERFGKVQIKDASTGFIRRLCHSFRCDDIAQNSQNMKDFVKQKCKKGGKPR